MFKKAKEMTFGVRINTDTGIYHVRCELGEETREPEAHAHLNRVGALIGSLETGFYVFNFKPILNGLTWSYEWARMEEEPPQP